MISLTVNKRSVKVDVDPSTPLLWVLREHLGLTGTKYGCGVAQCGACTVHLDGRPGALLQHSGIARRWKRGHHHRRALDRTGIIRVQRAWLEIEVPQCGYCQSGQIMSAVALLEKTPNPADDDINRAMSGNICRCGTYPRIRRAIHRAAEMARTV